MGAIFDSSEVEGSGSGRKVGKLKVGYYSASELCDLCVL